jgi:sirohydrochlorin ferrochelatase
VNAVWIGWVVLAVLAVAVEIAGRLEVAGTAPLGDVVSRLRARGAGRVVLVLAWAWLGWHLFAR